MFQNLLFCTCSGSALTTIPAATCLENFGQVQKLLFQKTKDGSTVNEMTIATENPELIATWNVFTAASDDTKVVTTPLISAPSNETGEAREFGGGNETLNGVPYILGSNPSPFECKLYGAKQDVIAAMKTLMCDAQNSAGLSVFLVNEAGQIAGATDDIGTPTKFKGFSIQSFFVSDKRLGNYDAPDENMIKFQFKANWSDTFYIVTPTDFDALTEL